MKEQLTEANYEHLETQLNLIDDSLTPAELHGLIISYMCASSRIDGLSQPLLSQLLSGDSENVQATRHEILALYKESFTKLQEMDFAFQIFLPNDDASIDKRARALSYWCQGFLTGFNNAGIQESDITNADIKDAISRFTEISIMEHENIASTEEDESAFTEIVEYVRMAVLMIYTEFTNTEKNNSSSNLH